MWVIPLYAGICFLFVWLGVLFCWKMVEANFDKVPNVGYPHLGYVSGV